MVAVDYAPEALEPVGRRGCGVDAVQETNELAQREDVCAGTGGQ